MFRDISHLVSTQGTRLTHVCYHLLLLDLLHIHRQSAFLFGRDRNVVDVPIEHPSCSKQHAVLQFRQIVETDALGQAKRTTK